MFVPTGRSFQLSEVVENWGQRGEQTRAETKTSSLEFGAKDVSIYSFTKLSKTFISWRSLSEPRAIFNFLNNFLLGLKSRIVFVVFMRTSCFCHPGCFLTKYSAEKLIVSGGKLNFTATAIALSWSSFVTCFNGTRSMSIVWRSLARKKWRSPPFFRPYHPILSRRLKSSFEL